MAAVGTAVAVNGSTLTLAQVPFEASAGPGVKVRSQRSKLAIGRAGSRLKVLTRRGTQVSVGGVEGRLSALSPGTLVIAGGKARGGNLEADFVSDLTKVEPPPGGRSSGGRKSPPAAAPKPVRGRSTSAGAQEATRGATSLCMGQSRDYGPDPTAAKFQGCYGGPSASDSIPLPDIPVYCIPLVGCFVLSEFSYDVGLAGWGFAFPFGFSASDPGALTYHVPGSVALKVTPLPAADGELTFWGGLGGAACVDIDFCTVTGCYSIVDDYCLDLFILPLSQIHKSTAAAPLPGASMPIDNVVCPSIEFGIPDTPIVVMSIGICEALSLTGEAAGPRNMATARAVGNAPLATSTVAFDAVERTMALTPDDLSVDVTFDNFWYVPEMEVGLAFAISAFNDLVPLWTSPTIPISSGGFGAITTPYPDYWGFTEATDPDSPASDPEYLEQPTEVTRTLPVKKAPTLLTIISSRTVAEGEPVRVRLEEEYWADKTPKAPIAGQTVVFTAGSLTLNATTDSQGVARVVLPIGEYTLDASFAGSRVYLASSDRQARMYVYRPTNFVIWGGNAGGIQPGERYLFWGSQWWKQVVSGDPKGIASFKGHAEEASGTAWQSQPGNSVSPPSTLPGYIGVIVTTQVGKHGSAVAGNIVKLVVLRVENPSTYRPDPGRPAWGEMKAVITP